MHDAAPTPGPIATDWTPAPGLRGDGRRGDALLPAGASRCARGGVCRALLGTGLVAIVLASSAAKGAEGGAPGEPPPAASAAESASSPVPGLAAGASIDVRVSLGFSGVFRLGTWAPLTVTLENRRSGLRGHLEVRVPDGDELGGHAFTNIHRRPVDLPGGSRKRFHFTVYLKSFSRPIEVRVVAGGRERARERIDLRNGVTNARIVLVLGRDADLDYLNDEAGRRLRVLYPRAERLPEHWVGYEGVSVLVMHGLSLEGLSTRQYGALTKWLAGGGILAVSGGPDYGLLRTPRLASLLPGPPRGLTRLADGRAAGSSLGAPLPASRPFHVNRVPDYEGRVLYRAGRTPLVIERSFGRGRVLYLTFDISRYPFDGWPGMTQVWHALFDLPPRESLSARLMNEGEASALPGLIQDSPLSFPEHPVVLVFVVLYLGCVTAACDLRPGSARARRRLSWLRWSAPLLFAPGAWFLFGPLLFPPGPVAVVAARISPHPEGPLADLDLEIALFSSTEAPLRLDYAAPEPALRAPGPGAAPRRSGDWRHEEGALGGSIEPAARGRYRLHTLEGRDVIAWDLHASLSEARDGFELIVGNRSGRALHQVWLVLGGNAHPLESLPPDGESKRIPVRERDAMALRDRSWRRLLASAPDARFARSDAHADMIARELARLRESGGLSEGEAVLLGFSPSPLRLTGPSAAWRRHELALVLMRIPVPRRVREAGGFRS